MNAALLPPIPQPPHDPTSWLLDRRAGWRNANVLADDHLEITVDDALVLAQTPDSGRSLTDPDGSFGGLTTPVNVALGPDGSVYLLDGAELKRFDPCTCQFEAVPCLGGKGDGPRQLSDPHGIAIWGGNLFICDTGNHRVSIFALHGFALRGHWLSPAILPNPLPNLWTPYDITFDSRGRAFITDSANGAILRFTSAGPWDAGRWDVISRFNRPKFITSDCQDNLYVTVKEDNQVQVQRISPEGEPLDKVDRPEQVADQFPPLPFGVDKDGNLHLSALCLDGFGEGDIKNVPSLITKLRSASNQSTKLISQFIWAKFDPATTQLLTNPSSTLLQQQSALIQALNKILRGNSIYEPTRFTGVVLRPETLSLITQGPTGERLIRLNRLLLEDAYPLEIATGVFDRHGTPMAKDKLPPPVVTRYEQIGVYCSKPLDSALYRCQWHRVILYGQIPPGASVVVSTYTAEADLLPDEVVWETLQTARAVDDTWDCLIRSGGGRYLWLKLEFRGNGRVTPKLERIVIEFPRISLSRFLPAVFLAEPHSADFTDRFLSLFDTTLRSIETQIDWIAAYFDPMAAPAKRDAQGRDFLSWLASWIGITLGHWPEAKQRRFLKQSGRLFNLRGTREGLWRQLLLLLDLEPEQRGWCAEPPQLRCSPPPLNCAPPPSPLPWTPPPLILEHFKLRRWLFVGAGRLGEQALLWGKRIVNRSQLDNGAVLGGSQLISTQDPYHDPFHVYAHRFTVFVPVRYRCVETQRRALEKLLATESPAHTVYQLHYVEPRFRIGFQSMIGFDSVIARLPPEMRLGETKLGPASLLGTPPYAQGEPSFEIGKQGRIGTTTKLG
jgi:phage tail-like protein